MAKLTFRGRVLSGVGEGRIFTDLNWAKEQFQEKIGFKPYSGTLNIQLVGEDERVKLLRSFEGIEIKPPAGFSGGKCFKASIMKRIVGAVVIPDSTRHASNILEMMAPVNLRRELNLKDGDEVDVQVWLE